MANEPIQGVDGVIVRGQSAPCPRESSLPGTTLYANRAARKWLYFRPAEGRRGFMQEWPSQASYGKNSPYLPRTT